MIGAWAMAYHGQPRYTGDLDLLFRPSEANALALIGALRNFGAPVGHLSVDELATSGTTVTFGVPPSRVDLLNWLSGLTYDDAESDAEEGELGPVGVRFLSRRAFVVNKTAAGRPKDLLDAQILSADADGALPQRSNFKGLVYSCHRLGIIFSCARRIFVRRSPT